jgi:hypothetical protein
LDDQAASQQRPTSPGASKTRKRKVKDDTMAERIKLGGLWLNRTRDGREYLSGKLSPTVKILIFPNDFKSGENQPSHVMYLAPIEQEEGQRQNPPDQGAQSSFFNVNGNNGGGIRGRGNGTLEDEGQGAADEYLGEHEIPARTPVGPTSRPGVSHPAVSRPAATRPVSADRSAMPSTPVTANRGAAAVPTQQRRNAGRSDAGTAGSLLTVDNGGGNGDLDDLEDPF